MTRKKQLIEFMESEIPSANIQLALKKFKDEIMELHNSGYAIHQIQRYLTNIHSLKVARQTIGGFIRKEKGVKRSAKLGS